MKQILLKNIENLNGIYENFSVNSLFIVLSFGVSDEYDILYDILMEVVVSFLLSTMTFIIILTPLVLIYCWIYYSWRYVRKFKSNKDFKQIIIEKDHIDLHRLPKSNWPEYRKIYSRMVGFAVAIIAYTISSNVYMFSSFNEIRVALKEYFGFPFRVFKGLNTTDVVSNNTIPLKEVWFGMLIIVCISLLVFYMVYFIVKATLNIRFKKEDSSILQPDRLKSSL